MSTRPQRPAPPRSRPGPLRAAAALCTLAALAACGDAPDAAVARPADVVRDLDETEPLAVRAAGDVRALLLEALARGRFDAAAADALSADFAGRRLAAVPAGASAEVSIARVAAEAGGGAIADGAAFVEHLFALGPLAGDPERVDCELVRFDLDANDRGRAAARARLRWAGPAAGGGRVDVTLFADLELRLDAARGAWRVARFDPVAAAPDHPHGGGHVLRSPAPRFVDRTASAGVTHGTAHATLDLVQRFLDRHRPLSLGGLTVVDWNGDDRPDLIDTRQGERATLLLNDGRSGFTPAELPFEHPSDIPSHAIWIDLDGDGLEEIVGAGAADYEGGFAYAPLWTRSGGGGWRTIPRAFAMPHPIGVRRLAVQTAAPIDFDGDGDLDLFFAVYGDARSRGEDYNAAEALDGGDNHVFQNDGDLTFTEVSEEVGVTGTGYSYIALRFDADHDGDPDLFEGNDFGPNVLWRNEGGRFVADESMGLSGRNTYTMGVSLADLEVDGRWDLYVSNMSSEEGARMLPLFDALDAEQRAKLELMVRGNTLYSERGPGEPWEERASALGLGEGEWAWACHWLDGDGTGAYDLFVTNGFASHSDRALGDFQTYYWRQVLDDGVALMEGRRSRDVNPDKRFRGSFNGYERDRYFVRADAGGPDRPWVDAGYVVGLDLDHDGRAAVPVDADGDGDLDLVVQTVLGLRYLENLSPEADFARLRLVDADGAGVPLGARVVVEARGTRRARHVGLVEGFQSQLSRDLHVGLGRASRGAPVDRVEVTWPDGAIEVVEGAPANRLLVIQRGAGLVDAREVPRWTSWDAGGDDGWAAELATIARTPLAMGEPDTALVVRVHTADGPHRPLYTTAAAASRARVIDAYLRTGATWERSLDASRSVLLSPELWAAATRTGEPAALVTTARGEPVRILRGDIGREAIDPWVDVALEEPAPRALLVEAGRLALEEARFRDALRLFIDAAERPHPLRAADAPLFEGLARAQAALGRLDLAVDAYREAVKLDPDYALGQFNLGAALVETGRPAEALPSFEEARRIEGSTKRVLGALAEATGLAGDTEDALEHARGLIALDPSDPASHVLEGNLLGQLGRYGDAEVSFREALELDPANADARRGIAAARAAR